MRTSENISIKRKMPRVTTPQQDAISEFLYYFRTLTQYSIDELQHACSGTHTKQSRGQLEHYRKMLGVISWLISLNEQRSASDANS